LKKYKLLLLTLLFVIPNYNLFGQICNKWTAFYNKDSSLIGFKDDNGNEKIEPSFQSGYTIAQYFEFIIADENEYILKNKKRIGRDSVYYYDNTPDCESEGFIRFRDRKTDKVGMFNSSGDIVIPAVYNDLTRVVNGFAIGLQGAKKITDDSGEHYIWDGGEELLIDTSNKKIIEKFKNDDNLNLFSVKVTNDLIQDSVRKSFKGIDGKYYSFVDFEKEFKKWLEVNLFHDLTQMNLVKQTYKVITFSSSTGWKTEPSKQFIKRNYKLLESKLKAIAQKKCEYFIDKQGLNQFIFERNKFEKYYNNCGESKDWIYPTMSIVISNKNNQDYFEFLRTDKGYRLLSMTLRSGKIK